MSSTSSLRAVELAVSDSPGKNRVVFGVCATCDPRVESEARQRTRNIVRLVAEALAERIHPPGDLSVEVVYTSTLIDGEKEADGVARRFKEAGVGAIVCVPDTWAFPQLTLMSLMAHFPKDTPLNITCGNSAPKPGVVFAHAVNGAFAQSGRLTHLNVGRWEELGANPAIAPVTIEALVQWCYAAMTFVGLKGRRLVCFGHDSMGMETALAHVNATRSFFGLEIARLDMKLLVDMLHKEAYDLEERKALRAWLENRLGGRIDLSQEGASKKLNQSLALYLIMRDLMKDHDAVGGGFMNQLEWGSDRRGIPLPICDLAESLFNSTFDHTGRKPVTPFGTEADMQGTLSMLFTSWLGGGSPPLFMDFRKVWEASELRENAARLGVPVPEGALWAEKGIIDGNNSGSASFDWAAHPGTSVKEIMERISLPGAVLYYFPGGGNSVTFVSPGGISGIACRLCYSELLGMFSFIWDEASTVDLPSSLAKFVAGSSNDTWPHTWVVPKYATMAEYKQYAPANHFHMVWNLSPAVLQYWMDMTNVLSVTPWQARPRFCEGIDRPAPLLHLICGGEDAAKRLRMKGF